MKKNNTLFTHILTLGILSGSCFAQQPLSTPAELKNACQNSPGNIVSVNQSVKMSLPTVPYTPELVNCGCTVILNNEATFELEQVNIQFAGPFTIQSTGKGEVKLTKSSLKATAISFILTAVGSSIATSQSQLLATAGNLSLTLGQQAKMELYGRFSSSSFEGLSAAEMISIYAGERFTGSVADMAVLGQQGIQVNVSGSEGLIKVENTGFRSLTGSIILNATGNKSNLEVSEVNFFAKNETQITFTGNETGIKLSEAGFFGPSTNEAAVGNVTITAAGGTHNLGKIEMAELSTGLIKGGISVTSAPHGSKGSIKLEKSAMRAEGEIRFETGNEGSTEIKENSLTSLTRLVIKSGLGGSCIAAPNRILSAPMVEACIPPFIARSISNQFPKINPSAFSKLTVYPNPGINGSVNVNITGAVTRQDISVIDMNGRVVQSWKNHQSNTLKINNLRSGTYNLQTINIITGEKKSATFVMAD